MKEDFLQYIWKHHVRLHVNYTTEEGICFTLLDKGIINTNAGADIAQARMKIGEVEWAGSVEFHVKASEWEQHGHHTDAAYENVVLHVVAKADKVVYTNTGRALPTFIFPKLQMYYEIFQNTFATKQFVYCEKEISEVPLFLKNIWLQGLVVERLAEKIETVFHLHTQNQKDWEETFYQIVARYLGQKLNGDAFEQLARKLPQRILAKHRDSIFQLEALLFGQAGMLQKRLEDDYYNSLQQEYLFLQKKYDLHPMQGVEWKFLRLRPANFPTLRIAQLAMLIHQSQGLFSQFLEKEKLSECRELFSYGTTPYWDTHYTFGKQTTRHTQRKIGKSLQEIMIVNSVIPMLFAYARYVGESSWQQKALRLLQEIKPEQNHIVQGFRDLGFEVQSAYDSQALLQLKQKYCELRRCEHCTLGHEILKRHYE